MQHSLIRLVLSFSLIGFLGACSSSDTPSPADVIPDLPKVTEDSQESPFQGVWTTGCEPEQQNGIRSYQTVFHFEDENLTLTTSFFFDESCTDKADEQVNQGTYELSRDKKFGDNMLAFDMIINDDMTQTLFMRTMMLNDGQFIVTRLKSSEKQADEAVADIPLYRQDEWEKIKDSL